MADNKQVNQMVFEDTDGSSIEGPLPSPLLAGTKMYKVVTPKIGGQERGQLGVLAVDEEHSASVVKLFKKEEKVSLNSFFLLFYPSYLLRT
jgi:hypothetical protein